MSCQNEFCKLLILSNEGISNSSSNGRTLRNFLIGWPKEKIAQFYINDSDVDKTICENYYQVKDSYVVDRFLGKNPSSSEDSNEKVFTMRQKVGRDAFTMLVRNLAWNSRKWWNKEFSDWLYSVSPQVILLQAGDSAFMFKLARDICKMFRAPLVIYNSENWYFKKYDYFRAKGIRHLMYPFFRWNFKYNLRKTTRFAYITVYNSELLKNDYDEEIGCPSTVLYTSTEMIPASDDTNNSPIKVSYLGNLGLNRHKSLIELANELHSLSNDLFLDVYGSAPDDYVIDEIIKCDAIRYYGVIDYSKVIEVMHNSDILIHSENFSPFFREGLKRAFSTKIADSLASGRCFLLYAPEELVCSKYLIDNKAAYVVTNKDCLKGVLQEIISSKEKRKVYIQRALDLVSKNHNAISNAKAFQNILVSAYMKTNRQ